MLHEIYERHVLRLAAERCPASSRGRPRVLDDRNAMHGIFRILRTGMQWRELRSEASYASVHRRMSSWTTAGVFRDAYRDTLRVYRKLCPPTQYAIDSLKNVVLDDAHLELPPTWSTFSRNCGFD